MQFSAVLGKRQTHSYTPQSRAKRSALFPAGDHKLFCGLFGLQKYILAEECSQGWNQKRGLNICTNYDMVYHLFNEISFVI